MAQYAIAYAPNLTGGTPASTTQTGSFYIGNLTQGKVWNQVVPQSTSNTLFFSSPLANINNAAPYIIAIPNPTQPPPFAGLDQSQFFYSATLGNYLYNDTAFIETCDYILKNYQTSGAPATNPGNAADPTGCNSITPGDPQQCQVKINTAGWFQSYGFVPPA